MNEKPVELGSIDSVLWNDFGMELDSFQPKPFLRPRHCSLSWRRSDTIELYTVGREPSFAAPEAKGKDLLS